MRIVYRDTAGWMFRDNLNPDPAIDSLRPADLAERGLMQAFFLRSGIGEPTCEDATEQALLVQRPKLHRQPDGERRARGHLVLGDVPHPWRRRGRRQLARDQRARRSGRRPARHPRRSATTIREGFRSVFCLGNTDSRGADGEANDKVVTCNGSRPERIPSSDVADYCQLRAIASNEVLNYPVGLFCPGDRPAEPPPPLPASPQPGQPTPPPTDRHAVQRRQRGGAV